jgi:plastocyanin
MPHIFLFVPFAAIFAAVFIGADGCANPQGTDPTPVQTFKITPAATQSAVPGATATATVETPATATPQPVATATVPLPSGPPIAIVGIDLEFEIEEISAPPGVITVEFDNRDGGVVHNIHFFEGDDNNGESVARTKLEVGPVKQTLTFEVQLGEYFYQCDAHPSTMTGILTVE